MEPIVRNVRDIDAADRSVLEHVVGQALRDDQRLVIEISDVDFECAPPAVDARPPQKLADWTAVYEGLSDEQIDAVDQTIKTRANLTRNLP